MKRVAIIGSGISGLGCAHFLSRSHDITLFEKDTRLGGHTHTLDLHEEARPFSMDTGFMVYNERTYPLLTQLFASLDIRTKPTSMSFSVRHDPEVVEYRGTSFNTLFAQRRNLVRPRYWRFLAAVARFNREAAAALAKGELHDVTLECFLRKRRFGDDFRRFYLQPIGGAVWSVPPGSVLAFPAETLIRFFHNHGFLGYSTHFPWRTVDGGASRYVRKLTSPLRDRIRTGDAVARVERQGSSVHLYTESGGNACFDAVILACHADQALSLLARPSDEEAAALGAFRYQPNNATIHTDASVMPRSRTAWASWNYRVSRDPSSTRERYSTHYWMNSLQGLTTSGNYFVSLNADDTVDPARVIRQIVYRHPVFDTRAVHAQSLLPALNRRPGNRVFFCGSYFGYGFHEDGLRSAYELSRLLLGRDPWPATADAPPPESAAETAPTPVP